MNLAPRQKFDIGIKKIVDVGRNLIQVSKEVVDVIAIIRILFNFIFLQVQKDKTNIMFRAKKQYVK